MRVVDLRPRTIRLADSLWKRKNSRGEQPENTRISSWGASLSAALVDRVIDRRARGRGFPPARPYVLSVGNLALGGTGKTPVVAALASDLAALGYRGCILTRGYRSSLTGPVEVSSENEKAGDEARMLSEILGCTGWTVIQSRNRRAGLDLITNAYPAADIVIVEDGHQTADLPRHLDILILDQWRIKGAGTAAELEAITGSVFPLGPYRESARGARRAAIWLVETSAAVPANGQTGATVCSFTRSLNLATSTENNDTDETLDPAIVLNDGISRWAVLSGIAGPETFEKNAGDIINRPPCLSVRCEDHVSYTPDIVRRICQEARVSDVEFLVTTAKDWVKLAPCWEGEFPVFIAEITINWTGNKTLPQMVEERLKSAKSVSV